METQQALKRSRVDEQNTWKNCIYIKKKILMKQITMMVWLVTQSQSLECEINQALRSTAVDKASECDEIPAELFKSLKMMPSGFYTHCISNSGRLRSGHRTGKHQSPSQFPSVVPKKVLTIRQLHSSSMLLRSCLKSCIF